MKIRSNAMSLKMVLVSGVVAAMLAASSAIAWADNLSVSGWGPTSFPAPTTPPANAPWGADGYPGDTISLDPYAGSLALTPGTYVQQVNTLNWSVDYTYGGTATDPNEWSDVSFDFALSRTISLNDVALGAISQMGHLDCTWETDYLTLDAGPTSTFYVPGYSIAVTPQAANPWPGGAGGSGDAPWVQTPGNVYATFVITAVPEPGTLALLGVGGLGLGLVGFVRRRKARA